MDKPFGIEEVKRVMEDAKTEVGKSLAALSGELEVAKKELSKYGSQHVETNEKLERISGIAAKAVGEVEALGKLMKEASDAIDMHAKQIDSLKVAGIADSRDHAHNIIEHAKALWLDHNPRFNTGTKEFDASKIDQEEVGLAIKAFNYLFRAPHEAEALQSLSAAERKALTTHGYSNSRFLVTPQISNRILSCFDEKTDLTGLVTVQNVSKGSVVFMVDKGDIDAAGWQCDTDCLANSNAVNFRELIGEKEIRVNSLRFKLCASRALLDDQDIDLVGWASGKVRRAYQHRVSEAIVSGDGDTKPYGFMSKMGEVPISTVAQPAGYTAGTFTWQDLIALKYAVNVQYHANGGYLVNQDTLGKILTMSDANNRPIWVDKPGETPVMMINGSPVRISTWMPNSTTGGLPVFFGDLKELYTLLVRRALTMVRDDITAPWCVQYNWEMRVGGDVTCPAAGRLLQVG